MLEKILESPSDKKEIKPVKPKGNQPWIFIRRTDAEAEAPTPWPPDVKSQLTGKDPDAGKDWGQKEKRAGEDAAAAAKSLQSCLILCDPLDGSPPGSPIPGILQARTLEWVAISFSNAWKWKGKVKSLSRVWLFATPWTAAYQAPLSLGFSSKSTGVGCHCLLRGEYEMVR